MRHARLVASGTSVHRPAAGALGPACTSAAARYRNRLCPSGGDMSEYLLIGPVLLEAFELPARVGWGGRQRMAVHRLPGGRRVIDAMGRDDADIAWTGVFTGSDAVARARA